MTQPLLISLLEIVLYPAIGPAVCAYSSCCGKGLGLSVVVGCYLFKPVTTPSVSLGLMYSDDQPCQALGLFSLLSDKTISHAFYSNFVTLLYIAQDWILFPHQLLYFLGYIACTLETSKSTGSTFTLGSHNSIISFAPAIMKFSY